MNMEHSVILGLVVFIVFREAWHTYNAQLLINKLMSRGHYEYKLAETLTKAKEAEHVPEFKQEDEFDDPNHVLSQLI